MPLEIRELVIKATIGDDSEDKTDAADTNESGDAQASDVDLIVEKVLEILKEVSER